MSDMVKIFDFEETAVRVQLVDDEPWWVANDVCDVLELEKKGSHNLGPLEEDEKQMLPLMTSGGVQHMWMISESGLYSLIFRSRKEKARRFRKWVTSEVLPSIRKHGRYELPDLPSGTPLENALAEHDLVKASKLDERLGLLRQYTRHFGPTKGRRMWMALGLPTLPEDKQDLVLANLEFADTVALFAAENLQLTPGEREGAGVLYDAYQRWCEDREVIPETQTAFGRRLGDIGYEKAKSINGGRIAYKNVKLVRRVPQAA